MVQSEASSGLVPDEHGRVRPIEWALLGLLILSFFLLALRSIGRFDYYPSEQNLLGPALEWLGHPERFKQKYPPFADYFYYPFLALEGRVAWILDALPPHGVARLATLLLSCASLCLLWGFARRVGGARFALLAAFFLAANHSFFALSQLAQPEALLAFLVIAHLWFSLGIVRTGKPGHYLGAAVVAAAAVATKYFALALVLPVAAHLVRARSSGTRSLVRAVASPKLGLFLAAIPLALALFVPNLGQFLRETYPIIRTDAYFTNSGPCCMRLPETGPYRAVVWPALVLLPYSIGLCGYLAALAGILMAIRPRHGGRLAAGSGGQVMKLLVLYVAVVFGALQVMTSYFAPHTFTALFPAMALLSGRGVEGAARWAATRFPDRRGRGPRATAAAAAICVVVLGGALPGLYSVTAFYEAISTNGNRARALLAFAAGSLAPRQPARARDGAFGGGFDMVASSHDLEELAAREPVLFFLMDCFVENVRKRAASDPDSARLYLTLRSVRSEERYVQAAVIAAPDWWGRGLYERIDPELSLDMRFYIHRSIFDPKSVETMLAEFERRYPPSGAGKPRGPGW